VVLRYQCPELFRGELAHARGQALQVGDQHGAGLGSDTGAFDRVKRRKLTLKPVDHELEDPLRSLEALQTVFAQIEEADPLELLVRCEPAVERDNSTWPPCPTAQMRLARCTPTPTYPSVHPWRP
jgi:hypothetical protein